MNGISKVTLIIVILWSSLWIWVAAANAAAGNMSGIVVYIFFGLPTTLVGWFLWWLKHPEEKPPKRRIIARSISRWPPYTAGSGPGSAMR